MIRWEKAVLSSSDLKELETQLEALLEPPGIQCDL
jgi:hypothetical protein